MQLYITMMGEEYIPNTYSQANNILFSFDPVVVKRLFLDCIVHL